MAKLTSKARNALPNSAFAGPNRSFPIEDRSHAIAAERLVGRAVKAGSITESQASHIRSRAEAKVHRTDRSTMTKTK